MKYAHLEVERRFLLASMPEGIGPATEITDFYITGTRLRLRQVITGVEVVRKLGQKVRLGDGPHRIAHTTIYLNESEWDVLAALPSCRLRKIRFQVERNGLSFAIDQHDDGTLIAEFDGGGQDPGDPPQWLDVIREVTDDESYTGGQLAAT